MTSDLGVSGGDDVLPFCAVRVVLHLVLLVILLLAHDIADANTGFVVVDSLHQQQEALHPAYQAGVPGTSAPSPCESWATGTVPPQPSWCYRSPGRSPSPPRGARWSSPCSVYRLGSWGGGGASKEGGRGVVCQHRNHKILCKFQLSVA